MFIVAGRQMREWTVEIREHDALFRFSPQVEDHTAISTWPRVWAARGLGVVGSSMSGLLAALGEVMKAPAYWQARDAVPASSAWGPPRWDDEDGFVYIAGPVGGQGPDAGFRAVPCFTVGYPDIRGLRVRVAACLVTSPG